MIKPRQPVLIGDADPQRAEWLSKFLGNYYNIATQTAGTFDMVCMLLRPPSDWSAVFLADTLPLTHDYADVMPEGNLAQVRAINRKVGLVSVVTRDVYPEYSPVQGQVSYVRLPSVPPSATEMERLAEALKPLNRILPRVEATIEDVKNLSSWDRHDRTLYEQIRSLSPTQDLSAGENQLYHVIRNCISCQGVEKISIESLSQGKSGARVFHLVVFPKADAAAQGEARARTKEYVLKLSEVQDVWKLQSEVSGYLQAKDSNLYSKYEAHLPSLEAPLYSKAMTEPPPEAATETQMEELTYIASSRSWNAIYYDFLGGSLGECMSLETALVSAPAKLREKTRGGVKRKFILTSDGAGELMNFRLMFLDTVLSALCDIWYFKCRGRDTRPLWQPGVAPKQQYLSMPPYQFTERTKHWAQEFLSGDEAEIGGRLFPEWEVCRGRIMSLIECEDAASLGQLGREAPVTLSPVHGDLNANNIFLWLKQEAFPFLIDLPFYQPAGHVLQDFARLEVDIKFAMMDRQKESPPSRLAAYDLDPEQVPLWRELEDQLLDDAAEEAGEPVWHSARFQDNVSLTYRMVKIIRNKAELAQQQPCAGGPAPVAFMDEYLPALLYHTVRAVTYPSLSLFKRMLAVYSAGSILGRLTKTS